MASLASNAGLVSPVVSARFWQRVRVGEHGSAGLFLLKVIEVWYSNSRRISIYIVVIHVNTSPS